MCITHEVSKMIKVAKGTNCPSSPIPQDGEWTYATEIKDLSGLTHGAGWCAPQQGVT